jgi:hypothetical protein
LPKLTIAQVQIPVNNSYTLNLYNSSNFLTNSGILCSGGLCPQQGASLLPYNSSLGMSPFYYYKTQKFFDVYECDFLGIQLVKIGNSTSWVQIPQTPVSTNLRTPKYYIYILKNGVPLNTSPLVVVNTIFANNMVPIGKLDAGNYQITVRTCEVNNTNLNEDCPLSAQHAIGKVEFTVLPNNAPFNFISVIPDSDSNDCKSFCFNFDIKPGYEEGTLEYNFGDGYITNELLEPCYTYSESGEYTVSVKAYYPDCGLKTASVIILVGSPSVSISPSIDNYCEFHPVNITLTANANPANYNYQYAWSTSNSFSKVTTVSSNQASTYTVTVTNSNGCSSTASFSPIVKDDCCLLRPFETPCGYTCSPSYYNINLSQIFSDLCISGNILDFNTFPIPDISGFSVAGKLIVDGNFTLKGFNYRNTIMLSENAKIIIPVGSSLTLQNIRLQTCGTFWNGIEVHGLGTGNSVRQLDNSVGKIVFNNCEIYNARNAVTTSEKFPDGTFDVTSCGGIVQAKNTNFFDCGRAAELLSFHNVDAFGLNEQPNRSWFENCRFITTPNFQGYAVNHITLWDVNGVQIKGCRFEDQRTQLPLHQKGTGIFSIGASFTVERASSIIGTAGFNIKSTFAGLQNGIRSFASTSNPVKFSIYIRDAEFDCWKNIYLNGSDYARIHSNTFKVKGSGIKPGYGVHLEQCNGYTIENNDFIDGSTPGTSQNKIAAGVVVRNMQGNPTEVYRNRFNGLLASAIGVGDNNSANDVSIGHQFRCNDLTNTTYDFYVTRDLNLPNTNLGIARNQGLPNGTTAQLAGNLFGGSTRHFQNNDDVNFVDYWHHDPASNPRVAPDPNKVSTNFMAHLVQKGFSPGQSCPNRFVKGYDIRVMDVKDLVGFINKKYLIKMLVDGGNTQLLKSEVATASSPEAYQKYNELMAQAGLLSEAVVKEVIEKEDVFNNAMVRDIVLANPHVVKHRELNTWLDACSSPLPLYMRLQIDLSTENISQKELMEAEASGLYKSVADNITASLADFMDEGAVYNPDSALAWLASLHTLSDEMKRTVTLFAEGNEAEALAIIEAAQTGFADEKPTAKEDMQQYVELHELMRKFTPNSKHPAFLDSSGLENLKPLAYSNELYSPLAKGLLALNNALDYEEPIPLPGMESFKKENATNDEKRKLLEELLGNSLQIYPNPAADYTTVEFSNAGKEKTTLKITDLHGKTVWKQQSKWNQNEVIVPLKDLQNGVYIISVMNGNKTIASKNLIVQK